MICVATIPRAAPHPRSSSTGVSRALGLLRRGALLAARDRASLRKVTVISAPPGSGKTSLLRVWSDRAGKDRRVAFVTVPRDQQDAQEFWIAVLEAIRQTDSIADSRGHMAASAFAGEVMVDVVVSELAKAAGVVVLVIDDLHELSSAEALSQLERQPIEVQSMLLRTSVADRLNGELADLLAGRPGCEQMLLALEDANAFVVSLDAQRVWFRYHQLLADFLRLELRRTLAEEVPDLHRKAAAWFADHGEVVAAIRHTLAAGDWPDAARLLSDHLFSLTLDGQEGSIAALLRSFPAGAAAEHPELALAHAATQLAQGRLEDASAHLVMAESHLESAPPARRRRLEIAHASLRLALARRSGQFAEVVEQVNLLDTSTAVGSSDLIGMDTELRAVALMNLGIVETWSGQFADADRHVTVGATLAQTIGRPYIEVACRAYQAFPSTLVSLANARERGRDAFALAERHGMSDRPALAPALGALACMAVWTGDFEEGERWLRRGWQVVQADIDPAAAVLLHMVTGMLHAGRGEHQSALEALTAAVQAQSLLTGVHILAPVIAEWLAAAQARLGMRDEARATLDEFSIEHEPMLGIDLARAAIKLAEGDDAAALAVLGDVQRFMPPPSFPAYALVEAHVLAGLAHLALGDRNAAASAA